MSVASQTAHRVLQNPCLPFVTNSSPVSTQPQFFGGQNVLTSIQNILERFPGFSTAIESSATTLPSTAKVVRQFAWKKWDTASTTGSYFWMICVADSSLITSKVYKLEIGVDASFVLIHTDNASSKPFDFIAGNNTCFFGNATSRNNMRAFDGVTASTTSRLWGIDTPVTIPTFTVGAGVLNAYAGYHYLYTYGNSLNANESSPSDNSLCTGLFTGGSVSVTVVASADTQVDQIRIYRTTDGGSEAPEDMAEITGSPFTNTNQTVVDQTLDADLGSRFAPALLRNDPPPAARGFVTFANRIWMCNSNKVYFTGFEEITNGVQEECVPSGNDGNFYPYPSQVNGLAGLDTLVAVATTDTLFGIDGDSLDSFRRYTLSARNGVQAPQNIATISLEPGTVLAAWLDTADTVWMLGSGEIGLPIRPTLSGIDHSRAALAFHIEGIRRWLLVLDGATGQILPYDLDSKQWMPPRIVNADSLYSGETAAGVYTLCIGHSSKQVLKMVEGSYNDNGTPYTADVVTNLFSMTPDANPQWRGVCDYIGVESDAIQPTTVSIATDDDPGTATFTSQSGFNADLRTQGSNLKEKYYKFNTPAARRVSFRLDWDATDGNFKVYGMDIAFHPVGR